MLKAAEWRPFLKYLQYEKNYYFYISSTNAANHTFQPMLLAPLQKLF